MSVVLAFVLLFVGAVIGFGIAALMVIAREDQDEPKRKKWYD